MKKGYKKLPLEMVLLIVLSVIYLGLLILEINCNIFSNIKYLSEKFVNMGLGILQMLIIVIFINRGLNLRKTILNKSKYLEEQGINNVYIKGIIPQRDAYELYGKAGLIKICVVGGINYFRENKNYITDALKRRNIKIRVLLANENSDFVKQIKTQLDDINKEKSKLDEEIIETKKMIDELNACMNNKGTIEVRQYDTEYRIPFYLGYFRDNENADWEKIKGWYNSIIPVCPPRKTIMFSGELNYAEKSKYVKNVDEYANDGYFNKRGVMEWNVFRNELKGDKRNFIVDLETHFDYLWKKYDV